MRAVEDVEGGDYRARAPLALTIETEKPEDQSSDNVAVVIARNSNRRSCSSCHQQGGQQLQGGYRMCNVGTGGGRVHSGCGVVDGGTGGRA